MQQTQSRTKEALCHNGCLVVIRVLLVPVAAVQALLSWVPVPWLGARCISLTGLITGTESSATAISAAVGGVSHATLTRLRSGGWWTARLVLLAAVRVVSWSGGEGWLSVDDVLIPTPYARRIACCGWDFDHALRRTVCGLRLVCVVWCHGWLTVPLGF